MQYVYVNLMQKLLIIIIINYINYKLLGQTKTFQKTFSLHFHKIDVKMA